LNNQLFSINLPVFLSLLLIIGLVIIALYGHLSILLGVYIASSFWINIPILKLIDTISIQLNYFLIPLLFFNWLLHFYRNKQLRNFRKIDLVFGIFIFVWICWTLFNVIINGIPPDYFKIFFIILVFNLFIPNISISFLNIKGFNNFLYSYLLTEILLSFLVMVNFTAYYKYFLFDLINYFELIPASAYSINYHAFGRVAMIGLFFGLIGIINKENKKFVTKLFFAISIPISFYVIIWSGARQYLLGSFVGLILFVIWVLFKSDKKKLLLILLFLLIGSFFLINTNLQVLRFTNLVSTDMNVRESIWNSMWMDFGKSPLIGNGIFYGSPLPVSHGLILDSFASQGVIGFVFLLLFLGFVLLFSKGSLKRNNSAVDAWRIGTLFLFFSTLIQSQFSANMISAYNLYFVGFVIWRLNFLISSSPVNRINN